jgi:hypothetical protein
MNGTGACACSTAGGKEDACRADYGRCDPRAGTAHLPASPAE